MENTSLYYRYNNENKLELVKTEYCCDDLSDLLGKVIVETYRDESGIQLLTEDGTLYMFDHEQECCECVYLEDVTGDLQNLVGTPIVIAECVTNRNTEDEEELEEFYTWTFYKFATNKGYVTLRWYGTSNGYYSETVDKFIYKLKK